MEPYEVLFLCLFTFMRADAVRLTDFAYRRGALTDKRIDYTTHYLSLPVDHFGYSNQDSFQLRYLVADQYWNKNGGPIFLYTGNEGDIELFCNNTGFMWDIASEFKAYLLFVEHRYYGQSLPYGKDSFKSLKYSGFLTAEQALADFAETVTYVKSTTNGAAKSPVVAFGGSYGGMLSAWFRIKYPHIVIGSLAASAPVLWFGNLTPCNSFAKVVTQDFARESKQCVENIRKSWKVVTNMVKTESGRSVLTSGLRLCSPVKEGDDTDIKAWMNAVWGNLAMVDYPYSASFLENLPGWPIKEVCKIIGKPNLSEDNLIKTLGNGLNLYFNYTGQTKCLNTSIVATGTLGNSGWNFQSCSEMVMPMCSDGVEDMFEASPWNLHDITENCFKQYKLHTRPKWILTQFGGRNISGSSNIIFSNGKLDPWSLGGFMKSVSDTITAIIIDDGAHHLDLRFSNPADPPSVIQAREQEKAIIHTWINQYTEKLNNNVKETLRKENFYNIEVEKSALGTTNVLLVATIIGAVFCTLLTMTIYMKKKGPSKKNVDVDMQYVAI